MVNIWCILPITKVYIYLYRYYSEYLLPVLGFWYTYSGLVDILGML